MSTLSQRVNSLRRLTIREAEKSEDSNLYVINQAKPQKGNINITVSGHGGEKQTIQCPATYIPVDLSNQLEKVLILRNPHFRRVHGAGHIVIIHPDDAEKFLQQPEVRREFEKVYGVHATLSQEGQTVEIDNQPSIIVDGEETLEDQALAAGISPFIVNMVGRAESGENPNDLIAELDSQLTNLDQKSVRFLADNTAVPQIKEWATEAAGLLGD